MPTILLPTLRWQLHAIAISCANTDSTCLYQRTFVTTSRTCQIVLSTSQESQQKSSLFPLTRSIQFRAVQCQRHRFVSTCPPKLRIVILEPERGYTSLTSCVHRPHRRVLQVNSESQSQQDVGRGVVIPARGADKCGQPVSSSLLHHYVQRSGMVCKRLMLYQHVWLTTAVTTSILLTSATD